MTAPALPTLAALADLHGSDKGFSVLNAHGYTRVYESLLRGVREQPLRLLEIGLLHPVLHAAARAEGGAFSKAPSLQMWADYLPHAKIFGLDIEDFSGFAHPRVQILRADQGDRASLQQAAVAAGGAFDLIIDDGSHASHHQQITLGALLPYLNAGGVYVVEDLHYQPAALEWPGLTKTRALLQVLQQRRELSGIPSALLGPELQLLEQQVANVVFFDSLDRDRANAFDTRDALAVLKKR
ncbi:MAG: hypothetical protein ACKVOO_04500 [Burkholderiaceae bacterium]